MMMQARLWTHVLGAAIGLIVLFAMPSLAKAHAGHHQNEARAAVSVPSPQAVAGVVIQAKHLASFVLSDDYSPAKTASGCGGLSCCGNAPCPACAFVMSGANSNLEPRRISAASLPLDGISATGIGPQDLSRPPKSFV